MINTFYNKLKKNQKLHYFIKQFIKFAVVGILNSLLAYLTFKILTVLFLVNDITSIITGYIFGVINSFIFNKTWTFKSKLMSIKEAVFFIIVFFISLLLKIIAYKFLKEKLLVQKDIAFFIGMAVYTSINFLLNKYITFRK